MNYGNNADEGDFIWKCIGIHQSLKRKFSRKNSLLFRWHRSRCADGSQRWIGEPGSLSWRTETIQNLEELKNVERIVKRIDGDPYEIVIIKDETGNELQRISIPLKVELRIHDFLEIIVGASILSVPVAFTEEV
jgi:hypothetical protein